MELKTRKIHRYKTWAYCQITTLTFDDKLNSEKSLIDEVIKSKWFIWKGEEHPNGMTWHLTKENGENEAIPNVKIHGYYDVNLIESDDFQLITKEQMLESFIRYVKRNVDNSTESETYISKLKISIENELIGRVQSYQLKELDERKLSEFNVYSLFMSFLIIDKKEKEIKVIEFGQD